MKSSVVLSRDCLGRVLVVEEDARVAETIVDLLEAYEVVVAETARQAYEELCTDSYFDLVVCSSALGDLRGEELARRVERHRPGYGQRFVFTAPGRFGESEHERVSRRLALRTIVG